MSLFTKANNPQNCWYVDQRVVSNWRYSRVVAINVNTFQAPLTLLNQIFKIRCAKRNRVGAFARTKFLHKFINELSLIGQTSNENLLLKFPFVLRQRTVQPFGRKKIFLIGMDSIVVSAKHFNVNKDPTNRYLPIYSR